MNENLQQNYVESELYDYVAYTNMWVFFQIHTIIVGV